MIVVFVAVIANEPDCAATVVEADVVPTMLKEAFSSPTELLEAMRILSGELVLPGLVQL